MSSQPHMAEDHALLGELAGLAMDLARDAARRAKEAPDAAQACELMLAFERMARGVRLTLALKHRFARQAQGLVAEARDARKAEIRAMIRPLIRAQVRLGERLDVECDLDERLDREVLDEAFARLPLPEAAQRLRHALGLAPEEPANDPQPPQTAHPGPRVRPQAGPRMNSGRDPGEPPLAASGAALQPRPAGAPGPRPPPG